MNTPALRKAYLDFFKSKAHTVVPSAPLVLVDDPTVMFTSAGMNQFKEYFLGIKKDMSRAASCQRCLRTGDVDRVGKTHYHHTFFEMLGNFSFGDYFKREAISWAWEFLTVVVRIPQEKLWVSVYQDDDEAYAVWKDTVGVPASKIVRLGADSNFWPQNAVEAGPDGPCGPCSEIFFDKGSEVGCKKPSCSPACNCGRFVEIWNLVFTQFNRQGKGVVKPLPHKNIDTGMGLERLAAVMQNVESNFETDLFVPIIRSFEKLLGAHARETNEHTRQKTCAIADHVRAITFLIYEGVFPSNESRGYVLRMLIRRAFRNGIALGMKQEAFLYKLIPEVAETMKDAYPQLRSAREQIACVVCDEEKRFIATLQDGMRYLEEALDAVRARRTTVVDGEAVFKLYDTFGFPVELTELILEERGLKIDKEAFTKALERQRVLSRKSKSFEEAVFTKFQVAIAEHTLAPTKFIGYESLSSEAKVIGIFDGECRRYKDTKNLAGKAIFVLDKTPLYAESGGQAGDTGFLEADGKKISILDTKKVGALHLHLAELDGNTMLKEGAHVVAEVDRARRLDIMRNHTATHILQAALRATLGTHVKQLGSFVGEDYFRFDFSHGKRIEKSERAQIEAFVNATIMSDAAVSKTTQTLEEATKKGALAFFGEKYKGKVRVVEIEDVSKELCGGTHVGRTGEIGAFVITGESAVSAGVRRIEAKTGRGAYAFFVAQAGILEAESELLKASPAQIVAATQHLIAQLKDAQKAVRQLNASTLTQKAQGLSERAETCEGIKIITEALDDRDYEVDELRAFLDALKKDAPRAVIAVGGTKGDAANIVLFFTKDLVDKGMRIELLVKDINQKLNTRGGGRNQIAQLGGLQSADLTKALEVLRACAQSFIRNNSKGV